MAAILLYEMLSNKHSSECVRAEKKKKSLAVQLNHSHSPLLPLLAARCRWSVCVRAGGQARRRLDVDCWRARGGEGGKCAGFTCVCECVWGSSSCRGNLKTSAGGAVWSGGDLVIWSWSGCSQCQLWSRGRPVRFSALEWFPANMDDLGKFARRERDVKVACVCVCVRADSANTQCSPRCLFSGINVFQGVDSCSCLCGSAVCICPGRLS